MSLAGLWSALRSMAAQEDRVRKLERRAVRPSFERPLHVKSPGRIQVGSDVTIGRYAMLNGGGMDWSQGKGSITIGDRCWIGEGVLLYGAGGIEIGHHVDIGPGTKVFSSRDHYGLEHAKKELVVHAFGKVSIGPYVRIFADVTIGPGVTIGEGAVIGAKSLVLDDVPAWTVVGGVPAKVLKKRGRDEKGDRLGFQA